VTFSSIERNLAAAGLWCFPLKIADGRKIPLVPWREYQSRPPNDAELADWNRRFPAAGAGIPTGPATRIFVVDTDSAEANEWLELRGMPATVRVRTRKGRHYYVRYPLAIRVSNSAGALARGVDIRGAGGMVVAAGTRNGDFIYRYDAEHALGEVAIADAPDWLIEWLLKEQSKRQVAVMPLRAQQFDGQVRAWARKIIDAELETLAAAQTGTRNATLARISFKLGQLAGGGEADSSELLAALEAVASTWRDERSKSADTIARAFYGGQAHPRQRPIRKFRRRSPWAHTPGLAGEYQEGADAGGRG
jgi:putative DNA primase/helicase